MAGGIAFHETRMGQKYYQHDVPEQNKQLKRIADALEILANNQGDFIANEHPSANPEYVKPENFYDPEPGQDSGQPPVQHEPDSN